MTQVQQRPAQPVLQLGHRERVAHRLGFQLFRRLHQSLGQHRLQRLGPLFDLAEVQICKDRGDELVALFDLTEPLLGLFVGLLLCRRGLLRMPALAPGLDRQRRGGDQSDEEGGRQAEPDAPALALLGLTDQGLGPLQFGLPSSLLGGGADAGDFLGHCPAIRRPVLRLERKTPLAQRQ